MLCAVLVGYLVEARFHGEELLVNFSEIQEAQME